MKKEDQDKAARTFIIEESEWTKFLEWKPGVLKRAMEIQKKRIKEENNEEERFPYNFCWEYGEPYYGAIGGGFTFSFIGTSIGTAVSVKETITGEEINITDYSLW